MYITSINKWQLNQPDWFLCCLRYMIYTIWFTCFTLCFKWRCCFIIISCIGIMNRISMDDGPTWSRLDRSVDPIQGTNARPHDTFGVQPGRCWYGRWHSGTWIKHQNISKPLVWIGGGMGWCLLFFQDRFESFYHTGGVVGGALVAWRKACRYPLFCSSIICSISKQKCWFRGRSTGKQKSEEHLAVSYSHSCKIPRCQMRINAVFLCICKVDALWPHRALAIGNGFTIPNI